MLYPQSFTLVLNKREPIQYECIFDTGVYISTAVLFKTSVSRCLCLQETYNEEIIIYWSFGPPWFRNDEFVFILIWTWFVTLPFGDRVTSTSCIIGDAF